MYVLFLGCGGSVAVLSSSKGSSGIFMFHSWSMRSWLSAVGRLASAGGGVVGAGLMTVNPRKGSLGMGACIDGDGDGLIGAVTCNVSWGGGGGGEGST